MLQEHADDWTEALVPLLHSIPEQLKHPLLARVLDASPAMAGALVAGRLLDKGIRMRFPSFGQRAAAPGGRHYGACAAHAAAVEHGCVSATQGAALPQVLADGVMWGCF